MEVLQTSALPLGDGAGRNRIVRGIRPRQMMRQQQRDERPILMIIVLVNALQGGRRSKSVPHGREASKAATVVQLRRAHQAPAMTKEAFWRERRAELERCSDVEGAAERRSARGVLSVRLRLACQPKLTRELAGVSEGWSGKRDSNPRLRPWQGRTLPLSYSRSLLATDRPRWTARSP